MCDYHAWEYIVRGGDDADSVDATTGQIAGALYGYSGIPQEGRDRLVQEKRIAAMAEALFRQAPEETT